MAPLIKKAIDKNNLTDSERKHIPFITRIETEVTVFCGDGITHPMEDDHWIIFIELFKNGESVEKITLKKTDEPKAVFTLADISDTDTITAHAFCNLHGIWESL
ncbi:TPA: desulfoferrodoxin [Candidatus Gracilibacteria bacterium]|nr:desulfoferrodoxin [Candidatus Peregrinibacteria bacterium]HIQ56475.1 desulfoferrodoxin [Candidatus Gracilibacteria bacterium]